jgi:flagellar protein FliO/FliZ
LIYIKKLTVLISALIIIISPAFVVLAENHPNGDRVSEENGKMNIGDATYNDEQKNIPTGSDSPYGDPDEVPFISTLVKMILALLLIIGMIYGLVRLLSRNRSIGMNGPFRLIGGVHLAPNKSVQMIEVGTHLYIVGVGEDVRLLRHIDDQRELDEIHSLLRDGISSDKSEWKMIKNLLGSWFKKRKSEEDISFQTLLSEKLDRLKLRKRRDDHWTVSESEDQDGKPL